MSEILLYSNSFVRKVLLILFMIGIINSSLINVKIRLFSSKEDPSFLISQTQFNQLLQITSNFTSCSENMLQVVGYRGFEVRFDNKDYIISQCSTGERYLLEIAYEKGVIERSIYEYIHQVTSS